MKITKTSGPKIDPWGTPDATLDQEECRPSMTTL